MSEDKYTAGRIEQLTETPRTDSLLRRIGAYPSFDLSNVIRDFAKDLERENAKLRGQRDELVSFLGELRAATGVSNGWKSTITRRIADILAELPLEDARKDA